MIAIVNYGSGNIRAIANVYSLLNVPFIIANSVTDLDGAQKIILPGVGAFDQTMGQLENSGFRGVLEERVFRQQTPLLGICVGMQVLASASDEGVKPGLGWIKGRVRLFDVSRLTQATRLPHMGWNDVRPKGAEGLFKGMENEARFYFLHSYYFECADAASELAICDYAGPFACAVGSGNVYGVQFHPEKSHHYGVQLLKNFAEL
jgi:glutamine amidotransferase